MAEVPSVVVTQVRYSGPRLSRNLNERLMVRFPGAWRALARRLLRLSPSSRLKRAMLCREMVSGWDASWRRDYELMLVRYGPDVEVEFDPDFEALGLGGTFRGHEGRLKTFERFQEAWERWEVLPVAVIDMGDRVIALARFRLPGNVSGLELESEFAQLVTLRDGLVVYEQDFMAWDKGLRAAGLDPDALRIHSPAQAQAPSRAG